MLKLISSKFIHALLVSFLIGIIGGTSASIFLHVLHWVTSFRLKHQIILFLLPFAGFLIGWLYDQYGVEVQKGNDLIFEEMKFNRTRIPLRLAPMIFISTILTHLVGGSAGREGTAVQMSVSLSDYLHSKLKFIAQERRQLICLAIAAGFSGVFATPVTAIVFAIEVFIIGRLNLVLLFHLILSSFTAYWVGELLNAPHIDYTFNSNFQYSIPFLFWIIIGGIFFGLVARLYIYLHMFFALLAKRLFSKNTFRAAFAGSILLLAYLLTGETKFYGLGLETISASFKENIGNSVFFIKSIYTAFTIGFGFKGGEVTPLFFIGASAGNAFAAWFSLPFTIFAAIGFVSVFAGATNTPFACTIMGIELFGFQFALLFAIGCLIAFVFSGNQSIYKMQQNHHDYYHILKLESILRKLK
jgi:H+/Cl- antiporter ClcA